MYQKSEKLNFADADRPSELEIRQKRTAETSQGQQLSTVASLTETEKTW